MTQKRADVDYRYSIIPGGAVTDPNISMRDLQVLALLGRHTNKKGWCWRSQVEMAKELRCGRATISRSIKRLIETGWIEVKPLPRGRTVLKEGEQPFSAFMYRVKIDRDDEEEIEVAVDVPNNGHPPVNGEIRLPNSGQEVPIASGQEVPAQVGTHRRTSIKDNLNALPSAGADERVVVALLKEPEPERFTDFRKAVFDTWPGGWVASNEVACRKAFERVTRVHHAELVIACARLHGAAKRKAQEKRGKGAGGEIMRHPSNWLKDGDWEGYIPAARQAVEDEAKMTTALGNVRRTLGDGLFDLLRRKGMPDYSIAALDGVIIEPPAHFITNTPFQRILLDRHLLALERHLGARPEFTLAPKAVAS